MKYTPWWISNRRSGPRAFETLAGLACDGKTNRAGVPRNPLQLALILREFEEEIYFVRPPLGVQG
jgi:hypothetical protein